MSTDVVTRLASVSDDGSKVAAAVALRADVFAMTQAAHDAALKPNDAGGFTHAERAALATRIAKLNRCDELAEHYSALLATYDADEDTLAIADPAFDGDAWSRINAVLTFTDLVAANPKATQPDDVASLQAAGVSDADIVRLAELNAFLAYQIRLLVGLKLMRGAA
ncbi:hypothetical protein D5400_06835 [Georhizobium profundi]|uniref:CMD domain protein n=1 Tax=Georhizobium profundi TaxID=2341112 RepID=A0A3S9B278_9HYPH|nr:hypothetical protein [Georhizobium profundi]AZN71030.1 hypothetical protein D5400_06835 [Georhizobium profundi]